MAIQTKVTWASVEPPAEGEQLQAYIAAAVAAGKTDGALFEADGGVKIREWNTVADAEAFVSFCKSIQAVSAVVFQS